ncbi:MAG TPA: hypothetical protein GXZ96_06925 [Firmicutes bacterium]|jgi:hypothetical protein|nr:hypothetical protein [Bacillota bacterium]
MEMLRQWWRRRVQRDLIKVQLDGFEVYVARLSGLQIPHEVSIFVPRAEIRRRFVGGRLAKEEVLLNSITVVHAPRPETPTIE